MIKASQWFITGLPTCGRRQLAPALVKRHCHTDTDRRQGYDLITQIWFNAVSPLL